MPTINGILETALSVQNPKKSADFYRQLFNFETLFESDRLIALNVAQQNVLLLFQAGETSNPLPTPGGIIPGHQGIGSSHLAFAIPADQLPQWQQHLQSQGIQIESTVSWNENAHSLYLRDPDNHLIELMTPGFWKINKNKTEPAA